MNSFDVIVIGAGLSGIGAASYIQKYCPNKTICVLEMRDAIGGTWDLFRYPGIRSDSDMYTLGHKHHPWLGANAIADGPAILNYIKDIAETHHIAEHIHYRRKVTHLDWSSNNARWQITTQHSKTGESIEYSSQFILSCSGYYNYERGYTPNFKGINTFKGEIIHPQHWPENFDYSDKRIVIIGSGATAVTLLPSLAEKARQVTMLQRSPTYIMSQPVNDGMADKLRKILSEKSAYRLARWKNIFVSMLFFNVSKYFPNFVKGLLSKNVRTQLADKYREQDFLPRYNPWDERLCIAPNGDFFMAIRRGSANIVTDGIDEITERGILLQSGKNLDADVIITATGLSVKLLGDAKITVDQMPMPIPERYVYRGALLDSIPNLALISGYTNASWTLKANLINEYFCRLINYMDQKGYKSCVAVPAGNLQQGDPLINLTSGYFKRSLNQFPKQASQKPWLVHQNYIKDIFNFRYSSLQDKHLKYS